MLSSWRKSVKRGRETKEPFAVSLSLTCCYRFRILDGKLLIPLPGGKCLAIALNRHVSEVISTSGVTVRSFTITMDRLALCIAKEVDFKDCHGAAGVDRNLRNITYGNANRTIRFDLSKTVRIAQITKEVVSSFKRNDVRILKKIARKYGRRRRDRTASILHRTSKMIVEEALEAKEAIVLEDIRGIRALYVKGNGQGKGYRGMMNSWPYGEAERQIEYKAAWEGVTTVNLTKGETRGTSTDCPDAGRDSNWQLVRTPGIAGSCGVSDAICGLTGTWWPS